MSSGTGPPVIVFAARIALMYALAFIASGGSTPVTSKNNIAPIE